METKIIIPRFICILKSKTNKTHPNVLSVRIRKVLEGSYSGQHAYKISDNIILTSTGSAKYLQAEIEEHQQTLSITSFRYIKSIFYYLFNINSEMLQRIVVESCYTTKKLKRKSKPSAFTESYIKSQKTIIYTAIEVSVLKHCKIFFLSLIIYMY